MGLTEENCPGGFIGFKLFWTLSVEARASVFDTDVKF